MKIYIHTIKFTKVTRTLQYKGRDCWLQFEILFFQWQISMIEEKLWHCF